MIQISNLGTVATDAELKITPTGKQVCSVTVLFNYYDKGATDANGTVTNQGTISLKVTAWDNENFKQATYLSQLKKGDSLFVDASIKQSSWIDPTTQVKHTRLETLSISQLRGFPKGTAYPYISSKQNVNATQNPVSTTPVQKVAAPAPKVVPQVPQVQPVQDLNFDSTQEIKWDFDGSEDTF